MADAPESPPPEPGEDAPPDPPESWPDPTTLSDQELISLAVATQVRHNADEAHRLDAYATLRDRCEKDMATGAPKYFAVTPLRETAVEFSGALHVSEKRIETDLALRDRLVEWFPPVWARCLTGRLDLWRAQVLVDAAGDLADESDIPAFAELMEDYLRKYDDLSDPLLTIERHQLANAARYRKLKFAQKSADETYHEAFSKRRAWHKVDEVGTGAITATGSAHDVMACDYRLTLIAKKRCEAPGESRTLEQMRADTVFDLLLGRLRVGASNADLEQDSTAVSDGAADGADPASTFEWIPDVGSFARPVINVTVPFTTLAGLSEDPGRLSGGGVITAEAARAIAHDPTSTWYRMLTDAAGRFVELSCTGYQPSDPLWRSIVARDNTCTWPNCHRPATQTESDHRMPYPDGRTCESNLDSLCHRHHMVKHSQGVTVTREDDGTYVIRTRRGSTFRRRPPEM